MLERRKFIVGTLAATAGLAVSARSGLAVADGSPTDDLGWRCDVIQTVGQAPRHRAPVVTGVSLDAAARQIAVVGDDHYVSIYNFGERRFTGFLAEHRDWVRTAQFHPARPQLLTAGNDRRVLIWDSVSWSRPAELARHPAAIISLAISGDGTKLATVGFEQTARVYDLESGRLERPFDCACDDNHAVAFSTDGSLLAAGGRSGAIRVWNVLDGELVAECQPHRQRVRAIRFLEDGRLVSCSDDQTLRLISLDQPDVIDSLPREPAKQFDVIALDADTVATGRCDNRIAVWSISRREPLGTLSGHTGTVSCLAASDQILVSGSYDTQLRIWQRQLSTALPARQTLQGQGWNERLK